MIIQKIRNIRKRLKKLIEIIELVFYYNAKFNSTYPIFTIISIVICIILCSTPVIQQLFLRINYLPEEQVQFLDTTYQPLNKINPESIEDTINYNEFLSIARKNKGKNTNPNISNVIDTNDEFIYSIFKKEELNKIKNKPVEELDKEKLGKYISIIEYVIVDTKHIDTEYSLGKGQGVINKDTIYQTWKIQDLLETTNIEIPEQYLLTQNHNKKLSTGPVVDETVGNILQRNNSNSNQDTVEVVHSDKNNSIKINLDKNIPPKTFNLNDICVKNVHNKCIIHSPLVIWNYNITKLQFDTDIIDTITTYIQNNVNETVSFHSMFSGISFSSTGKIKSSNALILTFFLESKFVSGSSLTSSQAWSLLYKRILNDIMDKKYKDIKISQYKVSKVSKELTYNVQYFFFFLFFNLMF